MSEEETARIKKLNAETELLRTKLKKLSLEVDSLRHHKRFWYVPTLPAVFRIVAAGLALAASFFFLFQPIMDAHRVVNEKENTLAVLEARIRAEDNRIESQVIARQRQGLLEQLAQLSTDLKTIQQERENAKLVASQALNDFRDLDAKYRAVVRTLQITQTERDKFDRLTTAAEAKASELEDQVQDLQASEQATQMRLVDVGERLFSLESEDPVDLSDKASFNVVIFTDDDGVAATVLKELQNAGFTNSISQSGPNSYLNIKWGAAPDSIVNELASIAEREVKQSLRRMHEFGDQDRDVFINLPVISGVLSRAFRGDTTARLFQQ